MIHNNTLNKQHSQLSLLTPQFENILKYSHKHYKKYPVSTLHYRHVLVCKVQCTSLHTQVLHKGCHVKLKYQVKTFYLLITHDTQNYFRYREEIVS